MKTDPQTPPLHVSCGGLFACDIPLYHVPPVSNPETPADKPDRPASKPVPLYLRMYFQSEFIDLVRLLGYDGLPLPDGQEKFQKLIEKYGKHKMRAAAEEITVIDKASNPPIAKLTEQARKLAFGILGPPPMPVPPPTQVPAATESPTSSPVDADPALARLNKRQLRCRLRDARRRLEHNGKRSFVGKLAKKEIAVVEAEMRRRGMDIPTPEQETPDSDPTEEPQKKEAPTVTAVMQQYREAKERHPGMLLVFRCGDFYELFDRDAETAAKLLGLTVTTRDRTISMAGFPHHTLETNLKKLLHAGQRVAICEQVDGQSLAKGPVQHDVSRIVTPGTLIESVAEPALSSQVGQPSATDNPDPSEPLPSPRPARHFDPLQLRAEADRAVAQAGHAREFSEYPRYGESIYMELASGLRALADTVEETAEAAATAGHDRAARQTRRAAWLKRKAAYLRVQSLRKATESHDIASRRPFGQPIIVGHHSERGHRRDLERQHSKDAQAHDLWKQAKEAEHAAKTCESNRAIYADDPEAVTKLREKLTDLERQRDSWKELNSQYRKAKGDIDAMPIADALKAALKRGKESYYMGPDKFRPAESYQFQNLGAEIRRCQKRIDELRARESAAARPERRIGGIVIQDNLDFQKVELRFPGKPSDEARAKLKAWGFRWVRSAACWSRGINAETEVRLQWLAELVGQPLI